MGHTRLGDIPKLKKWQDIVALFDAPGGEPRAAELIPDVARLTLEAAEPALLRAIAEPALSRSFYLLAKLMLASRQPDWIDHLDDLGLKVPRDASLYDVTSGLHEAIELEAGGSGSDVAEMAQRAAGKILVDLVEPHATTLFGSTPEDVARGLRVYSTKQGFGELAQHFFGQFLAGFLNFYLSRVTAAKTGGAVIRQVGETSRFSSELEHHCIESARIVRDFAAEWYSKTEYVEGINEQNSEAFVAVALRKLAAETRRQGAGL